VRNKISTHLDTLPTKIGKRKTRSSTHSETISKPARSRAVKPRLDVKTAKATDAMSWPGLFVVDAPAHEGIG
ncbi:hypothetical protein, partial [Streptomyces griseus]